MCCKKSSAARLNSLVSKQEEGYYPVAVQTDQTSTFAGLHPPSHPARGTVAELEAGRPIRPASGYILDLFGADYVTPCLYEEEH
jgi:hypothetical protein